MDIGLYAFGVRDPEKGRGSRRVVEGGLCRIVIFSCVEDILSFIFNGL